LFTASLGVKCNHCHANGFEKDDKPEKQTARRMINMVFDLNKGKFDGRDAITCYTCHRGQTKPDSVVALGINLFLPQPAAQRPDSSMPTVDQILERYVQALGGRASLEKFTTRVSKGSRIGADGVLVPEEVYQKAPDKLQVITRYPQVTFTATVSGQKAWAVDRGKDTEITGEEGAELTREANFYKDVLLKEIYSSLKTGGKAILRRRKPTSSKRSPVPAILRDSISTH
jgi:Photosynthetic reaction centre cytochrome C subunit